MNKYIFFRPFCKLKRDYKLYIVVILQLIMAFGIMNILLSLLFCISDKMKDLEENESVYQIKVLKSNFDYNDFDLIAWGDEPFVINENGSFPFSLSEIEQINRQCANCKIEVELTIDFLYLGELINTEEETLRLCYVSDIQNIRCSKRARDVLADVSDETTINAKDFPFTLCGDALVGVDGKTYEIERCDSDELTVYLPLELYSNIYHPKDLRGLLLNVKSNLHRRVSSEDLNELVLLLRGLYSDEFEFEVDSELTKYMDYVAEAEKEAKVFVFLCSVTFVIVLIGMIGLFIMIINRRKKEVAICYALGQTKKQLLFELFAEVFMLNLLSYLLGLLGGCLIMRNGVSLATVEFTYHVQSGVILILPVVLLSAIVIIPIEYLLCKMSPVRILSSL